MLEQPRRIKRGWMNLRVSQVIHETLDTRTFYFVDHEDGGRAFDYRPGQYLTFRFDELGPKPIARSYTMSSSPCESDYVAVTIKEMHKGVVSQFFVQDVKIGDVLRARGPIGKFCYFSGQDQEHLAMIAAGSGVTPFTSMLREYAPHLGEEGAPKRMTLLVSYRSTDDLINWDLLQEVSKVPGIRIVTTLSRQDARDLGFLYKRIDADMLRSVFSEDLSKTTFMTCGPQEMMDLSANFLKEQGVPPQCIKIESYETA